MDDLKNNGTPLLYHVNLCASFQSHRWIQSRGTIRKRPIRVVKIGDFFPITLKFDGPWKTIGHFDAASNFVHHSIAIIKFKLEYSIAQEICTRFLLCCAYTLTDFPISIRLTSLALWQSNDCPSASKATLMNMDKYFMWIHYERLHNHNKAKHNKTVCIFLGI